MSIESARAFVEKMKTDQEFARQVVDKQDKEARIKFALAEGFTFTPEEVNQVSSELSNEDLEKVTGGTAWRECVISIWDGFCPQT